MTERAHVFGSAGRLVGISTAGAPPGERAAVVLVNSGVVHRIGANRMTVSLARALAGHGFDAFRFDMSSLGESSSRRDLVPWEESAPREICKAVDVVTAADPQRPVVLYGNCGGAAKSIWAALRDPRVSGLALTNPPPHPAEAESTGESGGAADLAARLVADDLVRLFDRGVQATFVYADGDAGLAYFERRLRPRLEDTMASGQLQLVRVPYSNHTFSPTGARAAALSSLVAWVRRRFGSDEVAAG